MKEDKIDMMQTALDHYEEAAAAINHWMSDIPEAIKQYYATPKAKECEPKEYEKLREFAIWMSGCRPDFASNAYFVQNKHLLHPK